MIRRVLAFLAAALVLILVQVAPAMAMDMIAEVHLNGVDTGRVLDFQQTGDDLALSTSDLRDLGFTLPADVGASPGGFVTLTALPGVKVQFDEAAQVVAITAPAEALGHSQFTVHRDDEDATRPSWGAVVNYSAYATGGAHTNDVSTTLEARAFGPLGVLSSGVIVGSGREISATGVRRLNTTWLWEQPDHLRRLAVGDFISSAPIWGDVFRAGGVSLASDFSMQPAFVTEPVPHISGASSVPSVVDLYVNGVQQMSTKTQAGSFSISQTPMVDGQGNVSLVVRDLQGHESVRSFSFYSSSQLLRPGLNAYALEAGFLREDAYTSGDRYADGFLSAALRRGVSDDVTVEFRSVASGAVQEVGGGAVFKVAEFAVVGASLNASQSEGRTGEQVTVNAQRSTGRFTAYFNLKESLGRFRTFESREDDSITRREAQAGVSWASDHAGAFSASYTTLRTDPWRQQAIAPSWNSRILAFGWSYTLWRHINTFVSVLHGSGSNGQTAASVGLVVPLGDRRSVSVYAEGAASRGPEVQAYAAQAPPTSGGLGWRAEVQAGGGDPNVQGGVVYDGPVGEAGADLSAARTGAAVRAYASGSVVLMGGRARLSQYVSSSFAVVETGQPNVGVLVENRLVGRTGPDGTILLPSLPSYATSHIALDPGTVALDQDAETLSATVRPRRLMGARVRMAVELSDAALVHIVLPDGRPAPMGSVIKLASGQQSVVGYDGVAYLTHLSNQNQAVMISADGDCSLNFRYSASKTQVPEIGPVACRAR